MYSKKILRAKFYSKISIMLILACFFTPLPSVAATVRYNLKQTVLYAVSHSLSLSQLAHDVNIANLEKKNAFAKFFPTIDLSSAHGYFKDLSVEGDNGVGSDLRLTFKENFYNNGEDITKNRQASFQQKINILKFIDARDKLTRDIANDYLDLSQQKRLYKIDQAKLKLLKDQYRQAEHAYKQGLKLSQDVVRFSSQVRSTEIQIFNDQERVKNSRDKLIREMGVPLGSDLMQSLRFDTAAIPTFSAKLIPRKSAAVKLQLQYRISVLQKEKNALDVKLKKREYWPQVNLEANSNFNKARRAGLFSSYLEKEGTSGWDVQLKLQYNLFDMGTRRRDVSIAAQNDMRQTDQLDDELLRLRDDMLRNYNAIIRNHENYLLSTELLKSEQHSFDMLEKNYISGSASYLDLINGITDLQSAQQQYMNDRYNLAKELNTYRYFKGTIYEEIIKQ